MGSGEWGVGNCWLHVVLSALWELKEKLVFLLEMYGTSILKKKDIIHFKNKNMEMIVCAFLSIQWKYDWNTHNHWAIYIYIKKTPVVSFDVCHSPTSLQLYSKTINIGDLF